MLHSSQYDMATIVSIYTLVKKPLHSPVKGTRAFSYRVQARSLASMLCIKFFLLIFKWAGRQLLPSFFNTGSAIASISYGRKGWTENRHDQWCHERDFERNSISCEEPLSVQQT